MQRSERRILTTHTGSLIRPASLVDPAADRMACAPSTSTEPPPTELRDAVEEVVRKQVAIGLDIVNDGEYGKAGWATYILDRLNGFEVRKEQLTPLL
jgi:5-methyltetrahydropteroyltriglutamate--homocysteine methyltransferase